MRVTTDDSLVDGSAYPGDTSPLSLIVWPGLTRNDGSGPATPMAPAQLVSEIVEPLADAVSPKEQLVLFGSDEPQPVAEASTSATTTNTCPLLIEVPRFDPPPV